MKINRFILTLLLSLLFSVSYAQEWFEIGTQWYYTEDHYWNHSELYNQLFVEKDTIVQNIKCKYINNVKNLNQNILYREDIHYIVYEKNDSVFIFNDKRNRFELLYNFAAKENDTYVLTTQKSNNEEDIEDTINVTVKKIETIEINGKSIRKQTISYNIIDNDKNYNIIDEIYEYIGSINYLNPTPECKYWYGYDNGWVFFAGPLRCYEDSYLGHYSFTSNTPCDYTNITEVESIANFAITPNPADESFAIKLEDSDLENIQSVSLFDENGKLVERFAPASEIVVDCSQMVSGVYVCQIVDKKGNISSKKVIVK